MYQDYVSFFMMMVMVFFIKINFIFCVCYKDSCLKLCFVFQKCVYIYFNFSLSYLYWILMFKGMNVLVWFVFLLNNCLYVYVMFVVIDFLYCNLINVIGWFYIMCLFELLIINY